MKPRSSHAARAVKTACIAGSLLAFAPSARAAGLYTADRGVRPLGRGGAFVAGADDLGAIWYNPAGLAEAGTGALVDFAWLNYGAKFTRRTDVTDAGGTIRSVDSPTVKGTTPFLPIPTIAASYNFGEKKEFTAAFGVFAPYTAISTYPLTVGGQPAASRYSLVTMDGSALVMVGGYFAYKPIPELRIGAGIVTMVGKFASRAVFSASPPDRVISAPEDPSYDTLAQLDAGPIIAPTGTMGIIAEPTKALRIGLSGQLPWWIDAPATINVRLPTAAPFDRARQEGEDARVKFRLPAIARVGVEYRAELAETSRLRVEAAYVREFWSMHDSIDVRSENIKLIDVTGFPSPFGVAPISMPRNFQDSNSFRLGGELAMKDLIKDYWMDLRAGFMYETSAIPREWVSPLTYDAAKKVVTLGGSLHVGQNWRFDAMGALVLIDDTVVRPDEARVPRINPVKGNPTATEPINGGAYTASALILGVGGQYRF